MSVNLDPAKIHALLVSTNGPVMKDLTRRATAVQEATRSSLKSGFPQDFLSPRIVKRFGQDGRGIYVRVGADKLTTRPHPIIGNPLLAFNWPRVGKFMILHSVKHPGSNFFEYLKAKLIAALPAAR